MNIKITILCLVYGNLKVIFNYTICYVDISICSGGPVKFRQYDLASTSLSSLLAKKNCLNQLRKVSRS